MVVQLSTQCQPGQHGKRLEPAGSLHFKIFFFFSIDNTPYAYQCLHANSRLAKHCFGKAATIETTWCTNPQEVISRNEGEQQETKKECAVSCPEKTVFGQRLQKASTHRRSSSTTLRHRSLRHYEPNATFLRWPRDTCSELDFYSSFTYMSATFKPRMKSGGRP